MTEILFSFDTEDYTSDHAADAIRDEANLLHEYGIKANFNLVGYVGRMLVKNRRLDVLDALKNHTVSFHSLAHSLHPTINEYTDKESFDEAYDMLMRKENEGIGMVKTATGTDFLPCVCPPGDSISYVAMYGYAELGFPLYIGSFFNTPDGNGVYCCNMYHIDYNEGLEYLLYDDERDIDSFLDSIASRKRFVIYNHPNMVLYKEFWDEVNYRHENLHPFGEWEEAPRRSDEQVKHFYMRMRELVEKIKSDNRFKIVSVDEILAAEKEKESKRIVTRDMLPAIRSALREKLHFVTFPVSLSVSECFEAAVHFLFSDEPFVPKKNFGFLYSPEGVSEQLTLSAEDVRRAAAAVDFSTFLPASFCVNGNKVGPADLLYACLDVACGEKEAIITPKEQQCDYSEYPTLSGIRLKGTWIHSLDFADNYLSDRLRLQAWTIRPEM